MRLFRLALIYKQPWLIHVLSCPMFLIHNYGNYVWIIIIIVKELYEYTGNSMDHWIILIWTMLEIYWSIYSSHVIDWENNGICNVWGALRCGHYLSWTPPWIQSNIFMDPGIIFTPNSDLIIQFYTYLSNFYWTHTNGCWGLHDVLRLWISFYNDLISSTNPSILYFYFTIQVAYFSLWHVLEKLSLLLSHC
jgi:hypothetical protein